MRLLTKSIIISALLGATALTINPVQAQQAAIQAKSGVPVGLGGFFYCQNPEAPKGSSGMASHGKVTVRQITQNHCGVPNFPVTVLVYQSEPGFKGEDQAVIFSSARGQSILYPIHVQ